MADPTCVAVAPAAHQGSFKSVAVAYGAVESAVHASGVDREDSVENVKGEHQDDDDDDEDDDNDDNMMIASQAHNFGSGQDPGVAKARPDTLVADQSPWWP